MLKALSEALEAAGRNGSPLAVGIAFLLGVIVGFTPCVYPVLPLVVAFIGRLSRGRKLYGLLYSLVYVFGMALVYSILAMVMVAAGLLFGSLLGKWWFLLGLGGLFLVLALWMLGVVRIPTPQLVRGGGARGGILGALGLGAASGLVVGPCNTPALVVLLPLIHQATRGGSPAALGFGAAVMFAYSMGVGSLIVLCGTFSGLLVSLPKSGRWLGIVEKALGVLVLGVAIGFMVRGTGRLLARPAGTGAPVSTEESAGATPAAPDKYGGVGTVSPLWELDSLDGGRVRLAEFRGKKGIVLAFFASWCIACREEVPSLNALHARLPPERVILFGVNEEEMPQFVKDVKAKWGIQYPILLDVDGTVRQIYGFMAVPRIIAIDARGVVRYDGLDLPEDVDALVQSLTAGAD